MSVNRKHPHCPWSTAQIRERVERWIVHVFGHRRGYEIEHETKREAFARAVMQEAWTEYIAGMQTHRGTPATISVEMWRATEAAFFDAFGIEPAQPFVYDERVG